MDEGEIYGEHVLGDEEVSQVGEGEPGHLGQEVEGGGVGAENLGMHRDSQFQSLQFRSHEGDDLQVPALPHAHNLDDVTKGRPETLHLLPPLQLEHIDHPELLEVREGPGDEADGTLLRVEVARVVEAVMTKLYGEKFDSLVLLEVSSKEPDGEVQPDEVAPHEVESGGKERIK